MAETVKETTMEINLNSNRFGNVGMGRGASGADGVGAAKEGLGAAHVPDGSVSITRGVAAPEDVAAAALPRDALSRDDELGKLVSAAFDLPPPPMPAFAD